MQLLGLDYLKQKGIEKHLFGHDFVYRYPESKEMPMLNPKELASDLIKAKQKTIAFYFHIPFCSKLCNFCHYYKESAASGKIIEKYLLAIKKELTAYRALLNGNIKVQSIFLGGGTPTMLKTGQLNDLLEFFAELFPFKKGMEISIESSPETLSLEKLILLRGCGFNRLSIGAQDFNEEVLRKGNRTHSPEQVEMAVENARTAGFENINIDLIYGLPGQNTESWKKTIEKVLSLELESTTASDLRVQKNTAFFSWKRELFPKIEEMREMYYSFVEAFLGQGYLQQFPYQFVKKGREMHFLENQWGSGEFVGIGASSCSFLGNWDYNNAMPLHNYFRAIEENSIGAVTGKKLSKEEQMKRFVGLGLKRSGLNRKNSGVSKKEFKKKFRTSIEQEFKATISEMAESGLIEEKKDAIQLSCGGLFFHDEIARKFF